MSRPGQAPRQDGDSGREARPAERPGSAAGRRPSVLIVREWEQQMSSSGCCGRLEGDLLEWRGERSFPERREAMEEAGPLYRALRERYDEAVDIRVVDPRNLVSLVGYLFRDFRRHGVGFVPALRTLFGLAVNSIVVNGRIVATGEWPAPAWLTRLLDELLEGREVQDVLA